MIKWLEFALKKDVFDWFVLGVMIIVFIIIADRVMQGGWSQLRLGPNGILALFVTSLISLASKVVYIYYDNQTK